MTDAEVDEKKKMDKVGVVCEAVHHLPLKQNEKTLLNRNFRPQCPDLVFSVCFLSAVLKLII